MSCRWHGYPWPSPATSPCRSSPLAGVQGYIPYPHIAAECMFELVVLLLPGHMWGSIGVHHLHMLLIAAVISFFSCFSAILKSLCWTSTNPSKLPSLLFLSSLVILSVYVFSRMQGLMHSHQFSFLLVYLSEFLFCHFTNSPEYRKKKTFQLFITLMRILMQSLVSRSFLILFTYVIFHLCLMASTSNILRFL